MEVLIKEIEEQHLKQASGEQRNERTVTSAYLGADVTWKGTLVGGGTIHIGGNFEGEVQTTGLVIIGIHGCVDGRITADSVVCRGRIKGHVSARRKVELLASAIITGSVATPVLSIEEGGLLTADVEMRQPRAPVFWEEKSSLQ